MKAVISLAAVVGAFVLVFLGGGSAVGVWKELDLPATSAAADQALQTLTAKRDGKTTTQERRAKAKAKARRAAKTRWVQAANRLCRSAKAETVRESEPDSLAEAEAMVSRLAEVNARYNARLAAIPPPPGQRAKVEHLKRLFARDEMLIERLREAVRERDPVRIVELSERLLVVGERESEIMFELGAFDCAF